MKQHLANWINRILVLCMFGLVFSCAKPTVVIRKPNYPIKKDDPVIVNKDEDKKVEEEKEDKELVIEEIESIPPSVIKVDQVISEAELYLGTPHRMGGLSKKGIDCSGLVLMSYKKINVALPRSTGGQVSAGKSVKIKELQKGDLVFFTYPGGRRITHVGMVHEVKGPNDVVFIHTSSSRGVRKDNLYSDYWKPLFVKARRVVN